MDEFNAIGIQFREYLDTSLLDGNDFFRCMVNSDFYYIVLQKYEFPAWTGAGFLVENLGQGGPQ